MLRVLRLFEGRGRWRKAAFKRLRGEGCVISQKDVCQGGLDI